MGPLGVFCSLFNQISPIIYPEESDFGVTELSVEGEIVRHHLKKALALGCLGIAERN